MQAQSVSYPDSVPNRVWGLGTRLVHCTFNAISKYFLSMCAHVRHLYTFMYMNMLTHTHTCTQLPLGADGRGSIQKVPQSPQSQCKVSRHIGEEREHSKTTVQPSPLLHCVECSPTCVESECACDTVDHMCGVCSLRLLVQIIGSISVMRIHEQSVCDLESKTLTICARNVRDVFL